jgi:hypothetical protein
MIGLSNKFFATMTGRECFVCHTDTEQSSEPKATTEQMFEVNTPLSASRNHILGLVAWEDDEFWPTSVYQDSQRLRRHSHGRLD